MRFTENGSIDDLARYHDMCTFLKVQWMLPSVSHVGSPCCWYDHVTNLRGKLLA